MKVVFFQNIISPHQLPLAKAVAQRVGEENFLYLYAEELHAERAAMGWSVERVPSWCRKGDAQDPALLSADLVYTGIRCLDLMTARNRVGKVTLYDSERWFKPPLGRLRLLAPRYLKMAWRFRRLVNAGGVKCLAIGPHAARDFRRMGILEAQIIPWGYFVESGHPELRPPQESGAPLKILWVGRMLKLKHVDTIIKAVRELVRRQFPCRLTLVGDGPERDYLRALSSGLPVSFLPNQPIAQVREIMRAHDVLVFASDGYDGWGAVVSEALEEGTPVLGSRESGAPAALLPEACLFSCRESGRLADLLAGFQFRACTLPKRYTAAGAAEILIGVQW